MAGTITPDQALTLAALLFGAVLGHAIGRQTMVLSGALVLAVAHPSNAAFLIVAWSVVAIVAKVAGSWVDFLKQD